MKKTSAFAAMLAASLGGMGVMLVGSAGARAIDPNELMSTTAGTQSSPAAKGAQTRAAQPVSSLSRVGERNTIAKAMFGGYGNFRPKRFPNGPGWTHAHVQRMARKRRNKQRNRKAHR